MPDFQLPSVSLERVVDTNPNTPNPQKLVLWLPNAFIGEVIPNKEVRSAGGIIIPETVQLKPGVCKIVRVSDIVDGQKYPYLKFAKDELEAGRQVPPVFHRWNAPLLSWMENLKEYVLIEASQVIGFYCETIE
ncbi:MAG: hypothetical protein N2111_13900 [Candidatus Sumerlaeaceae bacterium]|nr:hypothetical protein [Candidatus Sumerlaeaceae bacterium]